LSEQADYNMGIRDGVLEFLKQYPGVTVVANEVVAKGTTDFRGALAKVKASKPDAVILNPFLGATAENLLKQIAEMKSWTGYKLITTFVYLSDTARLPVGNFAEGMIIVDVPAMTDPAFLALSAKIEAEKGTLKDVGGYYTASTLDTVDLLTSLITKNGNDPVKVQNELSTGSFKGFIGNIKFDGNNFVRFDLSGTYIIKDGKPVLQ
jgi:ABC-type branched-subunit amino acid transport system substrate-binding protein